MVRLRGTRPRTKIKKSQAKKFITLDCDSRVFFCCVWLGVFLLRILYCGHWSQKKWKKEEFALYFRCTCWPWLWLRAWAAREAILFLKRECGAAAAATAREGLENGDDDYACLHFAEQKIGWKRKNVEASPLSRVFFLLCLGMLCVTSDYHSLIQYVPALQGEEWHTTSSPDPTKYANQNAVWLNSAEKQS